MALRKIFPAIAAALCCAFFALAAPAAADEAADPDPPPASEGAARERYFRFGAFSYGYQWNRAAAYAGKDRDAFYEEQFRRLSENNLDVLHMAISNNHADFERLLDLSGRYGIKLAPQLDFAYWRSDWTEAEMDSAARRAATFISRYTDAPQVVGWSVKEEIGPDGMPSLLRYYEKIRALEPEVKFWKLHNNTTAARLHTEPNTARLASDHFYAFWWDVSGGGYMATPGQSLRWVQGQLSTYRTIADELGHDQFWMVVNTGTFRYDPKTEEDLAEWGERFGEELPDKVRAWAADGRFGWSMATNEAGETIYPWWKYYLTPENCTRAQIWLAVSEGLTGFLVWSWSPTEERQIERGRITLAGRPGRRNFALDEMRETAAELEPFDDIIRAMRKTEESPVTAIGGDLHVGGFSLPDLTGRLAVVVNTAVGEWPAGSPRFWRDTDPVYLDDEGSLMGYRPFTDARAGVFELPEPVEGERVYDLAARTALPVDVNGRFTVGLRPGGGRFLFVGTPEEFEQVSGMMGAWVGGGFIPPRRAMELPLHGGPVRAPVFSIRGARMRGRCWPADGSGTRPVTEPRRSR